MGTVPTAEKIKETIPEKTEETVMQMEETANEIKETVTTEIEETTEKIEEAVQESERMVTKRFEETVTATEEVAGTINEIIQKHEETTEQVSKTVTEISYTKIEQVVVTPLGDSVNENSKKIEHVIESFESSNKKSAHNSDDDEEVDEEAGVLDIKMNLLDVLATQAGPAKPASIEDNKTVETGFGEGDLIVASCTLADNKPVVIQASATQVQDENAKDNTTEDDPDKKTEGRNSLKAPANSPNKSDSSLPEPAKLSSEPTYYEPVQPMDPVVKPAPTGPTNPLAEPAKPSV